MNSASGELQPDEERLTSLGGGGFGIKKETAQVEEEKS